jgi:hypothetical protein
LPPTTATMLHHHSMGVFNQSHMIRTPLASRRTIAQA